MAVQIKPGIEHTILVNDKPVVQDMDGNWCALEGSLTDPEKKYLGEYLQIIENTSAKEVVATFKG